MMNPAMIFKITEMWNDFTKNHPKFPLFLKALGSRRMEEGTVLELTVTRPDGDRLTTNVKLSASDLELLEQLRQLGTGGM